MPFRIIYCQHKKCSNHWIKHVKLNYLICFYLHKNPRRWGISGNLHLLPQMRRLEFRQVPNKNHIEAGLEFEFSYLTQLMPIPHDIIDDIFTHFN